MAVKDMLLSRSVTEPQRSFDPGVEGPPDSDSSRSAGDVNESAVDRACRLRRKARELRDLARGVKSFEARATLLCLAEDYERLSRHAERCVLGASQDQVRAFG